MENSKRDLFIDMVVDKFILKVTKLRYPLFHLPKTGVGQPKSRVSFHRKP